MRYPLFPFRWLDGRLQARFDKFAHRLLSRLGCDRNILMLILVLLGLAFFAPILVAAITETDSIIMKLLWVIFLVFSCRGLLTLHEAEDIHPDHWRFYTLDRAYVAVIKLLVAFCFVLTVATGMPYMDVQSTVGLNLTGVIVLSTLYLRRTPLTARDDERRFVSPDIKAENPQDRVEQTVKTR